MTFKQKELPKVAIKFANFIFILSILFCSFIIVYASLKIFFHSNNSVNQASFFYIVCLIAGVLFLILSCFALINFSNNLKVNLSIIFFATGITIYACEIFLILTIKNFQQEVFTENTKNFHDNRTKIEVLNDFKEAEIEAYPNIHPFYLLNDLSIRNGFLTKKGKIFPLGGISNKMKVVANENGYWMIYKADKYGFNNSNKMYEEDTIDIVITGDSFAEGWAVNSEQNVSGLLKKLNYNVINVGKGGNGPLIEYAKIKEYAEPLRPRIVLWFYYINDFDDLNREIKSEILLKYLYKKDFSQKLITAQNEIDNILINFVEEQLRKEDHGVSDNKKKSKSTLKELFFEISNMIKLTQFRNMLKLIPKTPETNNPIFKNILKKSNKLISDWGGKMYFIYLPGYERYLKGTKHPNRDFVMKVVESLGIPIIDIHEKVFEAHQEPLSLFPPIIKSHYNAEGYRLVSETIVERLKADGYKSSK